MEAQIHVQPATIAVLPGFSIVDTLLAILFAVPKPVAIESIAETLGLSHAAVRGGLEKLRGQLELAGPLQVVEIQEGFQLSTKPDFAPILAQILRPEPQKLSRSMMETLAIVAYKQPVTSSEIEAIRGVQSDYSLKALIDRGLIEDVGRKQTPGRPILYGTSAVFLHHFNLKAISDLPKLGLDLAGSEEVLGSEVGAEL